MAEVLPTGNAINFILAIALSFGVIAEAQSASYNFSILSLEWPVSYCTAAKVICDEPIKNNFTIHGLWPMYLNSGEATTVEPYNINKDCNTITPMPEERITKKLLHPLRRELTIYWSDIAHHQREDRNLANWKYQWEKHGMCFDEPDQPLYYFKTALVRAKELNILHILSTANIVPTNEHGYHGEAIEDAIKTSLGVQPTIICNDFARRILLLAEIQFCFNKNGTMESCERRFKHCPDGPYRKLWFPVTKLYLH